MRRYTLYIGALAALLLMASAVADARMHAPYRGHRILPANAALDTFATPAAAYSFRKLRTAYTGPAVKLQRVDTTIQIIGFVGNDFDTAAAAAFCTTACTVNTWYDQSGNGRHLLQATAANQPAYVEACNGALPCARATVATQTLVALGSVTPVGAVSMAAVGNRSAGTAASCGFIRLNGLAANRIGAQAVANGWFVHNGTTPLNATALDNAWHSAVGVLNGASTSLTIDGVQTTGSLTPSVAAGTPMAAVGGASVTCNFAEAVAWSDYALSPAEIAALQQNQQQYWMPAPLDTFATPAGAYSFRKLKSTYAGPAIRLRRASDNLETDINFLSFTGFTGAPIDTAAAAAHCAATSCFVATWYDQSGNARHWQQATAAAQPAYIANCNGTLPCARSATTGQKMVAAATGNMVVPASLSVVARRNVVSAAACYPVSLFDALASQIFIDATNSRWVLWDSVTFIAPSLTAEGTWHAANGVIAGASSVFNIDGTELTGSIAGNAGAATSFMGANSAGSVSQCDMTEAAIWNGYGLTAGERAVLQTNQKAFWGTP